MGISGTSHHIQILVRYPVDGEDILFSQVLQEGILPLLLDGQQRSREYLGRHKRG